MQESGTQVNFCLPGPVNLFRGELKRPKKENIYSASRQVQGMMRSKSSTGHKRLTFKLLVLPPAEGWDVMHRALKG